MDAPTIQYRRMLAITPSKRGFGFVVLEGQTRLVDWGVAQVWSRRDREFLTRIEDIVDRFRPSILVVEDGAGSRRGLRATRRIDLAATYAIGRGIDARRVTRRAVREAFAASGTTKQAIAVAISRLFPELEARLPRPRKPWLPEDERMNIFDALALALVALHQDEGVSEAA